MDVFSNNGLYQHPGDNYSQSQLMCPYKRTFLREWMKVEQNEPNPQICEGWVFSFQALYSLAALCRRLVPSECSSFPPVGGKLLQELFFRLESHNLQWQSVKGSFKSCLEGALGQLKPSSGEESSSSICLANNFVFHCSKELRDTLCICREVPLAVSSF